MLRLSLPAVLDTHRACRAEVIRFLQEGNLPAAVAMNREALHYWALAQRIESMIPESTEGTESVPGYSRRFHPPR